MKRAIFYISFALISICLAAEKNPWELISQGKTSWNPMTQAAPFKLDIEPVDSISCNVSGLDIGNFTKFTGKIYLDVSDVRINLNGMASNGVSLAINGTVKASDDNCLILSGKAYGEGSYGNMEKPIIIMLENAEKANRHRQEIENKIAEKMQKEEVVKNQFFGLITEGFIEIKEKKKVNFGSAISSAANGRAVDALNSIEKNWAVDILKDDGIAKSGQFSGKRLNIILKTGDSITADFEDRVRFTPKEKGIDIVALYSEDMDDILYLTANGGTHNIFLFHNGKLYKFDKKIIQSIVTAVDK